MEKERTRPFLLEPVFHGAPTNWAKKYFSGKLYKFRKENPEFDGFLKEIKQIIEERKLDYCDNILLFLNGDAEANWVSPKKSLFRLFIKLFNYDFSSRQTVDYIEECHSTYLNLIDEKLCLSNEYQINIEQSRWDGAIRDFLDISLNPTKEENDWDDYYFIDLHFGSIQESRDVNYLCDTKMTLRSGKTIYEDALILFDYYQGCKYLNSVLKFAIDELIKKGIIRGPYKLDYGYTVVDYYSIKRPHSFKIEVTSNG